MNLPEFAVKNRALMHFFEVLLIVAGIGSYYSLGKLEDPTFSVKDAVIQTQYPGATPAEVELEVTDRIEKAVQEMPQLDRVTSITRAGLSIVKVYIKAQYWSPELPQVWLVMRKKIRDIEDQFPPGVQKPQIEDDYGFVYGFVLALTGDGFTEKELEDYAKFLQKELKLVPGVSRVSLWGNLDKAIYIDVAEAQIAELGLTSETFRNTLGQQNMVVDAGHVDVADRRLVVWPTGELTDPRAIGDLVLRPSALESLSTYGQTQAVSGTVGGPSPQGSPRQGSTGSTGASTSELLHIRDVGTVTRGYVDPPRWMMRYNGRPAIGIAIANVAGGNILHTATALDARLKQLEALLPIGLDIHKISWQAQFVEEGIDTFMGALRLAMIIVLGVVTLSLGVRLGLVVGSGLLLAVAGVFIFMAAWGIDLQRISLGALIIALGMIVDDIIVVSDLYLVKMEEGMERVQAAIAAAAQNAKPLFWATTIAAFAFFPISMSKEGAGEFCRSLFFVVGASLWISWIFAMTLTPVRLVMFMPNPPKKKASAGGPEAPGRVMRVFRALLVSGIRHRVPVLGAAVAALAVAIVGFGDVKQMFFPFDARTQVLIDYWGAEGTRIDETAAGVAPMEDRLRQLDYVKSVTAFIGQGPPRFYLPLNGEYPYPEYAQLLIVTKTDADVDRVLDVMRPWAAENVPEAMVRFRRMSVGPGNTWKFQLRVMGPSEADLSTLRAIGEDGMRILRESPLATDVRIDMRQRVKRLVPTYDQDRGRLADVTRPEVSEATKRAQDGIQVGLYREGDDLYPILVRNVASERAHTVTRLPTLQIRPQYSTRNVPLGEVTDSLAAEWIDPIISRYDRRRQVSIEASPIDGVTFPMLRAALLDKINAIELPPGYQILWDGQYRSSLRSRRSLLPGMVPAGIIMLTLLVYLFNAYRPPLVILMTLPFAMIGITAGLLIFDMPFGFVAILGVLSLSGIMIRNSVVLLETIDREVEAGKSRYQAVIDGALSRARPVMTCATATGLGLVPLLRDVFWDSLAAAMLCGLLVGTVLTLVLGPVLYATLYGLRESDR
jgi:multidrug efflux pump subunit AcrB